MSKLFAGRLGAVFSADIAVPEHQRVVRFYSRVLSTGENPPWREDLMSNLGVPIIGVGERTATYAHLPLQWMPHVQVPDVAASVRRATEAGGSILMHATADDGSSHWAVLTDPVGAAFGIIPVVPPQGGPPEAADEPASPGRIVWLDLTVSDATGLRDFYREVIGWSVDEVAMGEEGARYADFNMLDGDGVPAAGICHARGPNLGLPPVWLIYLPVGDLAESLRQVPEAGGTVVRTMQGAGGEVVYALIQDPVGAYLALTQA